MVQLGYAESVLEPLKADINDFPSKIGGLPLWLNKSNLPESNQLLCKNCGNVLVLLLQVYTPEDSPPEAFHRVVYVFACKNGSCMTGDGNKAFKVLRCQLPQHSPLATPENPVDVCRMCGLLGDKSCSKCKTAKYCSKQHQTLDWNNGHKTSCGDNNPPKILATFPEFVIESDEEPGKDAETDGNEVDEVKARMGLTTIEGKEVEDDMELDEKLEDTMVGVDSAFLLFQRRISRDPDQVFRYARTHYNELQAKDEDSDDEIEPGDYDPLWCSDKGKLDSPPPCPHCQSPRTFEFQIMPQLVYKLNQGMGLSSMDKEALDWGALYIFSCDANCQPENVHYMEEVVWKQDFSEDGVQLPSNTE